MVRSIPKVRNGSLYQPNVAGPSLDTITLETTEWYAWLEGHRSFSVEAPGVTFTARKEERPGGWYWYAYCRREGKLHTAYLGKSAELTNERLLAVAVELAGASANSDLRVSGDDTLRLHQTSALPRRLPSSLASVPRAEPVPKHNLPLQLTPLIGREQDAATVWGLLQQSEIRLLTLIGTAGIGKTRLALQVAADLLEQFTHGIWFVPLASINDPELVIPAIAQTLGLKESASQPFFDLVKAYLQHKHLLLVLDNFEQVVGAAPRLSELLAACPQLKLLVTSREVLHLYAEQQFAVPPLAVPDLKRMQDSESLSHYAAVTLFVRRAQAVKPDFRLKPSNAAAVAEICVRLDGLPLAIELAAARVKLLSPQALLARLAQRLQVLTSGSQDVPVRQQTMRNTIAWSYQLLSTEERSLFRRLAVFVGGCTLEAVEAVYEALGDETRKVFDGVASLMDKSLVQQRAQKEEEPRLVMLETIREYGLECLESAGEAEATRQAHASYFLALAEEAAPELRGPQQAVWLERLEQEHDNLRATLEWFLERSGAGSSREMPLRLCGALWPFWSMRGLFSEGRTELSRALAGSEGVLPTVRAKALSAAADLAFLQSDDDEAEALSQESLDLYREIGDARGIASSLSRLAWVATRRGNFTAARLQVEESLELNREVGDKDAIAWSLFFLADNVSMEGEYTRGHTLLEESLAMFRALGNKRGIATSLKQSALWLFVAQGDQAIVRTRLEESLTLFKELGDKDGIAICYWLSGWVALSQGDTVTAQAVVEQSLALWRELGNRWYTAWSLGLLGKIATYRGDLVTARAYLEECLAILRVSHDKWFTAFCLEELAAVVTAQGEVLWAARLLGAAEALRDMFGSPLPPIFRADYEHVVAAARTRLGEQAFTAAWDEGRTMTPEHVFTARGPATISTSTPPAKPPTTYPDELTAREVEVLRLVAQGLTNEQVAEQLVISQRTVNTHLTSIYGKIGVSSRSAATRYAMEQHLV